MVKYIITHSNEGDMSVMAHAVVRWSRVSLVLEALAALVALFLVAALLAATFTSLLVDQTWARCEPMLAVLGAYCLYGLLQSVWAHQMLNGLSAGAHLDLRWLTQAGKSMYVTPPANMALGAVTLGVGGGLIGGYFAFVGVPPSQHTAAIWTLVLGCTSAAGWTASMRLMNALRLVIGGTRGHSVAFKRRD